MMDDFKPYLPWTQNSELADSNEEENEEENEERKRMNLWRHSEYVLTDPHTMIHIL